MSLFQKHNPVQPKPKHQNKCSSSMCVFLYCYNTGLQLCLDSGPKTTGLGLGEPNG